MDPGAERLSTHAYLLQIKNNRRIKSQAVFPTKYSPEPVLYVFKELYMRNKLVAVFVAAALAISNLHLNLTNNIRIR